MYPCVVYEYLVPGSQMSGDILKVPSARTTSWYGFGGDAGTGRAVTVPLE
jgi:hypothetical protein